MFRPRLVTYKGGVCRFRPARESVRYRHFSEPMAIIVIPKFTFQPLKDCPIIFHLGPMYIKYLDLTRKPRALLFKGYFR